MTEAPKSGSKTDGILLSETGGKPEPPLGGSDMPENQGVHKLCAETRSAHICGESRAAGPRRAHHGTRARACPAGDELTDARWFTSAAEEGVAA